MGRMESETSLPRPKTSSWLVTNSVLLHVVHFACAFIPPPGTDTVSTFLEWFVLYLVAFPEVQEKFHDDVCSAVGERDATLEDRSRTHFAEATILEVITIGFTLYLHLYKKHLIMPCSLCSLQMNITLLGDAPLPPPRPHRATLHVRREQVAKARIHNLNFVNVIKTE